MTTKNQDLYISPYPTKRKRNFGPLIDFFLMLIIGAGIIASVLLIPHL